MRSLMCHIIYVCFVLPRMRLELQIDTTLEPCIAQSIWQNTIMHCVAFWYGTTTGAQQSCRLCCTATVLDLRILSKLEFRLWCNAYTNQRTSYIIPCASLYLIVHCWVPKTVIYIYTNPKLLCFFVPIQSCCASLYLIRICMNLRLGWTVVCIVLQLLAPSPWKLGQRSATQCMPGACSHHQLTCSSFAIAYIWLSA